MGDNIVELVEKLLEEQLNWYKLQRHDFLNHWQVIMGYLQLKHTDKALAYMREALDLTAEQQVGQIPEPLVSASLLSLVIRLHLGGIPSEVIMPFIFKQEGFWRESWQKEYVGALSGYTTECQDMVFSLANPPAGNSGMRAEIILGEDNGKFYCSFKLYRGEDLIGERNLNL